MPDYVVVEKDYRDYLGCRIEDENENQIDSNDISDSNYLDEVDWGSEDYEEEYYDA